jgi:hypothetical protein
LPENENAIRAIDCDNDTFYVLCASAVAVQGSTWPNAHGKSARWPHQSTAARLMKRESTPNYHNLDGYFHKLLPNQHKMAIKIFKQRHKLLLYLRALFIPNCFPSSCSSGGVSSASLWK